MYQHMIIATLLLFAMGCSQRETPKPPSAQPQEAASNALTLLQKLVTEQNYRALGFESVDEVKEAQLGQPLAVYYVGLDKLKAYREGTDVNSLLTPYAETIYPVTVQGNVRSSVTIVHKEAGYEPASFGNADVVKALSRYRQREGAQNEFVLRILVFNMYYIARKTDNRITVVPVIDDPRIKTKAGEAIPIESLFNQLRPLADSYNELPM